MKRFVIAAMGMVLVLTLVPVQFAAAQESSVMTDEHIARIQTNCSTALSTIQRLHASDGPLRVNRGQLYDAISTKLMTRLNSRLALNKLDGSTLIRITSDYGKSLSAFRENYKAYDDQMSKVLGIDCKKQPVTFYDAVGKARRLREIVHGDVATMRRLIVEYQAAFALFSEQYQAVTPKKGGR